MGNGFVKPLFQENVDTYSGPCLTTRKVSEGPPEGQYGASDKNGQVLLDFAHSKRMFSLAAGILASLCLIFVGGCTNRPYVPPRSELVSQSASSGVRLLSAREERDNFFSGEKVQRQRLLKLIEKRSSSDFRDSNYRIGPGDELEVNVFDVPELNVEKVKVRESGTISLPLIGAVDAAGRTESHLKDVLEERLAKVVRNPQVKLFISGYGSQNVAVMGAVRKPGNVPLRRGNYSLLEILGEAGGVSEKAGNFINFIPAELSGLGASNDVTARARLALAMETRSDARDSGIEIYLDQVLGTLGGIPLEIPVRGGDMIIVPEAGKVLVEGEVQKGGTYDLGQQMTLLGALAAAGGITYGAKVDEIEVVREVGFERKARLLMDLAKIATGEDKDVRLRNGDIVRVPSDSGRRMRQDTFEGISRIINVGVGGSVNLVP